MKSKTILSVFVLVIASSCGSGSGNGSPQDSSSSSLSGEIVSAGLAGTWVDAAISDQMVINSDGSYTSSKCGTVGNIVSISPIDQASCPAGTKACGFGTVNVVSFNGSGGCLPVGKSTCAYALTSSSLIYTCGGTALTYQGI